MTEEGWGVHSSRQCGIKMPGSQPSAWEMWQHHTQKEIKCWKDMKEENVLQETRSVGLWAGKILGHREYALKITRMVDGVKFIYINSKSVLFCSCSFFFSKPSTTLQSVNCFVQQLCGANVINPRWGKSWERLNNILGVTEVARGRKWNSSWWSYVKLDCTIRMCHNVTSHYQAKHVSRQPCKTSKRVTL